MRFGDYLKYCRNKISLTQEKLVDELYFFDPIFEALDVRSLSRWENSVTKPTLKKQVQIIKYFKQYSKKKFPCNKHITISEEKISNSKYVKNLIANSKEHIINFPSKIYQKNDLRIININECINKESFIKVAHSIFEGLTNNFFKIDIKHFISWSNHESNRFFVAENNKQFLGMFFIIFLKPTSFDNIIKLEKKVSNIVNTDFANKHEAGNIFLLSFFAYNKTIAELLFIKFYSHLFIKQNEIDKIGTTTFLKEAEYLVSNMNLKPTGVSNENLKSFCSNIDDVLINENIVKIVFD